MLEEGDHPMKVNSIVGILACCVGLAALGGPCARAQTEIDPDHFELSNVEPFERIKIDTRTETRAMHYDGKFTLPYTVQCSGKSLSPGRYSVSLHSEGKIGQATLKRRDRAITVPGVVQKAAHKYGTDTLVVVELNGSARRLSAIQVAELDLLFEPVLAMEAASDRRPRRFEKLPLTQTGQRQ
jgi:hypothetical protein